jgi:Na+-translocating ferredoxin:NAD+ oxidoreductase RnfG subunit
MFYVAPHFLNWAKQLMKKIRASITKDTIAKHSASSQKEAYKFVIEDHNIESLFKAKAKELEEAKGETYDNIAVDWVWQKLMTYSFHA